MKKITIKKDSLKDVPAIVALSRRKIRATYRQGTISQEDIRKAVLKAASKRRTKV